MVLSEPANMLCSILSEPANMLLRGRIGGELLYHLRNTLDVYTVDSKQVHAHTYACTCTHTPTYIHTHTLLQHVHHVHHLFTCYIEILII